MKFFRFHTNKNKSNDSEKNSTQNIEKIDNELTYYKNELEKQKKQNTILENTITQFTEHHDEYDEKLNIKKQILKEQFEKTLSKKKILEFVEILLKDKNINIGYLPDYVEKQIYLNIFTILIGIVEHSLKSVKVEIMGHKLDISITPVPITEETSVTSVTSPIEQVVPKLQKYHKVKDINIDLVNSPQFSVNIDNSTKKKVSF
jgi:hypothetical protein